MSHTRQLRTGDCIRNAAAAASILLPATYVNACACLRTASACFVPDGQQTRPRTDERHRAPRRGIHGRKPIVPGELSLLMTLKVMADLLIDGAHQTRRQAVRWRTVLARRNPRS